MKAIIAQSGPPLVASQLRFIDGDTSVGGRSTVRLKRATPGLGVFLLTWGCG